MVPTTNVLDTLRHGVVQHFVLCGLSLFAVCVQFLYRVPSPVVAVWLSWGGLVLLGLGLVVLINRILDHPAVDATMLTPAERWSMFASLALLVATLFAPHGVVSQRLLWLPVWLALMTIALTLLVVTIRLAAPVLGPRARRGLRRLEQVMTFVIGAFILISVLLFMNGYRDASAAVEVPSEVVSIGGGDIEVLGTTLFSWADLRSWRRPGTVERVLLHPVERSLTWVGQPVVVRVRPGALGIPWVEGVLRDREKYYRQVLTIAPNAAGPRRERLLWLVEHQRWEDTVEAAREYVRLYPNDYDFIKGIAASLGVVGRLADIVSLLEPFMARQPKNYELLNLVGWGLHQSGQSARGIEILKAAVPLEPDNWMAYYHLGYAYRATGRAAEAIGMFERVLELRRHYPEIERELQMLRSNPTTPSPTRRSPPSPPSFRPSPAAAIPCASGTAPSGALPLAASAAIIFLTNDYDAQGHVVRQTQADSGGWTFAIR